MSFQRVFDLSKFQEASPNKQLSRDQLVYLARVAENAERFDDMCEFMKTLVLNNVPATKGAPVAKGEPNPNDLTVEERSLLSVAYKNVIGARRSSWRTLQGEDETKTAEEKEVLATYRQQIEAELDSICKQVLSLLNQRLLVVTKDNRDEAEVFYLKMAADYYRYQAEFMPTPENLENARTNYVQALAIAQQSLPTTHPIRLGLALNFSVCYFEILKRPTDACQLAQQAFNDGIRDLETVEDPNLYKESTLILQLLRDNLTLWSDSFRKADGEAAPKP